MHYYFERLGNSDIAFDLSRFLLHSERNIGQSSLQLVLQLAELALAHEAESGRLTLVAVHLGLQVTHLHMLHANIVARLLESRIIISGTIGSIVRGGNSLILGLISLPERLLKFNDLSRLQSVERHLLVEALSQLRDLLLELVTLGAARELILQLRDLLRLFLDLLLLLFKVHLETVDLSLLLEHKLTKFVDFIGGGQSR